MRALARNGLLTASLFALPASSMGCSATGSATDKKRNDTDTTPDSGVKEPEPLSSCGICEDDRYFVCNDEGVVTEEVDCGSQECVENRGCLDCAPGGTTCVGNAIHECTSEGEAGAFERECDVSLGEFCSKGECRTECDLVEGSPSNVGCEFWAVQLPNERNSGGIGTPAAFMPWGVVLSNASPVKARVTIDINEAEPGQPHKLKLVQTIDIPPLQLRQVELPMRHITGEPVTPDPPGPPYTWLSSRAFRITSTAPIIAYQLNTLTNSYSNDASLLLPKNGLGKIYRVLGYPTANPISIIPVAGIPDRSSVTVVGVHPNTVVTIRPSTTTNGNSQGIPPLQPGDELTRTIGPYDVLNLASEGMPGDMTGTIVESSHPVAVFTSGERAILPGTSNPPPEPRPGWGSESNLCCTDHIEEQLFPVTSLGKRFVITRSPPRTKGTYLEPDLLRFLGVAETTTVFTNLPPPNNKFTLEPGQLREVWTTKDIIAEATEPVMIGQLLVSQAYTDAYVGDPSLTIFPPVEQFRKAYIFLIPPSWTSNYVVIATPKDNAITLDGEPLAGCVEVEIGGPIDGHHYDALRCPLDAGTHTLNGELPFGITAYGYGSAGSFAFIGGADVKPIYEPPVIK